MFTKHKDASVASPGVYLPDETIHAVSGAVAGALTATFVCPLDVLKTRMQVGAIAGPTYSRVGSGLAYIVKSEGLRGLYRGLSPTLLAMLPNWAVYFTIYERLKSGLIASSGAGAATICVTNPLFVVKTRLQTQNMGLQNGARWQEKKYKGTFHALRSITKYEGLAGLYSGLGPSLMGIAHVAIQFPLYEAGKSYIAEKANIPVSELGTAQLMGASAASKMVASTATYPHEVIRSHMHVTGIGPFDGFSRTCLAIFRADGVKGFYRGCLTNLLRTTPAAALTFTSFELVSRALLQAKHSVETKQQQ